MASPGASLPSSYSKSILVSFDGVGLRESLLKYIHEHADSFSRDEIRRIVLVFEGFKEDYGYLLERLPENWTDIGESLDMLNEREAEHRVACSDCC